MRYEDIPCFAEVVATLASMGGKHVTAHDLCYELSKSRRYRSDAQLGIQRAIDKKLIRVDSDWKLSLTR